MTASRDFRFLYSLERKQNILPKKKKKVCLGTREESGNCFSTRVFLSLFEPSLTPPLAAGSTCCFKFICQATRGLCDHRRNCFQNVTGVSLEAGRLMWAQRVTRISAWFPASKPMLSDNSPPWQSTSTPDTILLVMLPFPISPATTACLSFYK